MAIKRKFPIRMAMVYCNGGCCARENIEYQTSFCAEEQKLCEGGPLECVYGCLGRGTYANACPRHVIVDRQGVITEVR